jgi:hypothetical protein
MLKRPDRCARQRFGTWPEQAGYVATGRMDSGVLSGEFEADRPNDFEQTRKNKKNPGHDKTGRLPRSSLNAVRRSEVVFTSEKHQHAEEAELVKNPMVR